jgi:hypothetical protein
MEVPSLFLREHMEFIKETLGKTYALLEWGIFLMIKYYNNDISA